VTLSSLASAEFSTVKGAEEEEEEGGRRGGRGVEEMSDLSLSNMVRKGVKRSFMMFLRCDDPPSPMTSSCCFLSSSFITKVVLCRLDTIDPRKGSAG